MIKTISIDGLDAAVTLARRKGARHLKIAIKSDGAVRLTVPYGIPEFAAKQFLRSKIEWIIEHSKPADFIDNGAHIGKHHRLSIKPASGERITTKVSETEISVSLPTEIPIASLKAQTAIKKACEKALLTEGTSLLSQRLSTLAKQHQIPVQSCTVKKMKSRWGACDHKNNITLNSYLMQLDWALIDYVICHELAHTKHHHHQKSFWDYVETLYPNYKTIRKELKSKATNVIST